VSDEQQSHRKNIAGSENRRNLVSLRRFHIRVVSYIFNAADKERKFLFVSVSTISVSQSNMTKKRQHRAHFKEFCK